ncbi:MAG TPA: hypothetical protein VNA88_07720 [Candidatus Kapabacteria bacterium]|nr:hypothetical protein [Candidatus Kapabacteria bacterium]
MRTIMMVTVLLLAATTMNAQDSTEGTRRNRVRLQGGVAIASNFEVPLINLNWHHRFFVTEEDFRLGPSIEAGLHWIIPYADVGADLASRDFSVRVGGGALLNPFVTEGLIYYWTGTATVLIAHSDGLDLEFEGRLLTAEGTNMMGFLTASLAFH